MPTREIRICAWAVIDAVKSFVGFEKKAQETRKRADKEAAAAAFLLLARELDVLQSYQEYERASRVEGDEG